MLSPIMAILGVVFALTTSGLLYAYGVLSPSAYFFTPIFLLIGFHTLVMQATTRAPVVSRPWSVIVKKALGKYVFWWLLIAGLLGIYTHHPFYMRFAPNTAVLLQFFLKAYLIAGLPYFFYVEWRQTGRFEWLNDGYLKVLSLLRCVWRRQWGSLRHRLLKRGYKSLLLSWLIRLHFFPVMVEQVYWGTANSLPLLDQPQLIFANVMILVSLLFLIDSINASIGYFWESTLTRTRFRAVDPYAFHWIVVLICYMPFIGFASNFIAFPQGGPHSALLFSQPAFEWVVNALTVVALLGIVLCTSCLGFSYSNLCYKKIQTRGPYAVVRHPGTVFKIAFFFFSIFRYESSFTWPIIVAFVFWMGVYIVRILCEERFLLGFREYRDYAAKTRYRLIPGVW